jgi:hypothetical protein
MALVSRPALPYLREYVVIDQPSSMAYVTADHQRQWEVAAQEIFAAARDNLAAIAGEPVTVASGERQLLRFVDSGEEYVTSRLLLDDWVASLATSLGGQPVLFAPDRDNLMALRYDPDVLPAFFELVENEYHQAARSLSPQAYTLDPAGRVAPLDVPETDPLAAAVHRASVIHASGEYNAQKEWLDPRTDAYIPSLTVAQRPDGSLFSAASWADGIESLLPKAEFVAFTGSDERPIFVRWPDLLAEVDLEPVPDLDPPRYRVLGWPQESTMERLRARVTEP